MRVLGVIAARVTHTVVGQSMITQSADTPPTAGMLMDS